MQLSPVWRRQDWNPKTYHDLSTKITRYQLSCPAWSKLPFLFKFIQVKEFIESDELRDAVFNDVTVTQGCPGNFSVLRKTLAYTFLLDFCKSLSDGKFILDEKKKTPEKKFHQLFKKVNSEQPGQLGDVHESCNKQSLLVLFLLYFLPFCPIYYVSSVALRCSPPSELFCIKLIKGGC